jgi:hypothetical protein
VNPTTAPTAIYAVHPVSGTVHLVESVGSERALCGLRRITLPWKFGDVTRHGELVTCGNCRAVFAARLEHARLIDNRPDPPGDPRPVSILEATDAVATALESMPLPLTRDEAGLLIAKLSRAGYRIARGAPVPGRLP